MKNLFFKHSGLIVVLIAIFFPTFTGLAFSIFGLAIAPPWTGLSGSLIPLLFCICIPIGLIFLATQKLKGWIKFVLAFLFFLMPIATLIFISSGPMITGMTNCQPIPAQSLQVRYQCESTSSDDTTFSYKFILEGRENFPILQVVKP